MTASPRVAVVGGGLAGLTIARQLNLKSPTRSVDVEVLEASPRVGGVIHTSMSDGFARECAANGALGAPRGGVVELAGQLGVEMIAARAAAKKRWIYASGGLRVVPGNPLAFARSDLLSARAKLRLLAEPIKSLMPGEPTVGAFFRHRLGAEVHDRVIAPFVNGIYAGDTDELSMSAAFPRVSEIASHGGLFRGLISRQLGGRRRGGPGSRETSAPARGMGEITGRLAEKLIGRVRLDSPVASIGRSTRGVDVTMESGKLEHYDAVVCALPAYAASPALVEADAELGELLATIPFAPIAVVHLGYRRTDIGHPLGGFGFLVAPHEDIDILGVVFESEIWDGRAPDGCALLRVMVGGRCNPDAIDVDDDALVAAARRDLEATLDISGEPVHSNLVRWPRAIAQYTVGHRERIERAERLAEDQGVVLAGASYRGVAVNAVAEDAMRVTRRVHEILAAPLAFLLALLTASSLLACSGGTTTTKTEKRDGGDASAQGEPAVSDDAGPPPTAPGAFRDSYKIVDTSEATTGAIAITVRADKPPVAALTSRGRNACGGQTRPRLVVHTLGGVAGAVVWIDEIDAGRDAIHAQRQRVTLADCSINPRTIAVGRLDARLEVVSLTTRRATLTVRKEETGVATLPMVPVGRAFEVPTSAAGVYELAGADLETGYAVVGDTPYIGVTSGRGELRFDKVPAGTYQLVAWHPPVGGKEAISARAEVVVSAGAVVRASIDLL